METSFCELKGKEVINVVDGACLGKIIDIVFDTCTNRVLGFVVPSQKKSWNIFKSSDDIFIPCQDICKIGEDVILVRVMIANTQVKSQKVKASKQIWQNPPQNANISATSKTLESNSQNEMQTQSTLGSTTQTNDNFLATLGNGFENGNDG